LDIFAKTDQDELINIEMVRHEDRQGKETKFVMLHTG
jgi:hypothetical protein